MLLEGPAGNAPCQLLGGVGGAGDGLCAFAAAAERAAIWRASPEMVGARKKSAVGAHRPQLLPCTLAMTMPDLHHQHKHHQVCRIPSLWQKGYLRLRMLGVSTSYEGCMMQTLDGNQT